jgi:predicted nucleotidyltransferase
MFRVQAPLLAHLVSIVEQELSSLTVHVLAVYLMGSRALDLHQSDSDYDFIVVFGLFLCVAFSFVKLITSTKKHKTIVTTICLG